MKIYFNKFKKIFYLEFNDGSTVVFKNRYSLDDFLNNKYQGEQLNLFIKK